MNDKKTITYSRVFCRNGHLLSCFIIFFVRFEASTFSSSLLFWTILIAIWCVYAQLCLALCDPMDCSLSGSSVLGIFQARILEWVAVSYSRLIFLTQGSNPSLLCFLHWQADSLPLSPLESLLLLWWLANKFKKWLFLWLAISSSRFEIFSSLRYNWWRLY